MSNKSRQQGFDALRRQVAIDQCERWVAEGKKVLVYQPTKEMVEEFQRDLAARGINGVTVRNSTVIGGEMYLSKWDEP